MKTKIVKRIVTFVVALAMVLTTSAVGVLADGAGVKDDTPVINIYPGDANTTTPENAKGEQVEKATSRFEAYQIFSGELNTADVNDELINIDWGNALVKKTLSGGETKLDYTLVLELLKNLSEADDWAGSGTQSKFVEIYNKVKDKITLASTNSDEIKAAAAKGVALEVSQVLDDQTYGFKNESDEPIATEMQKFAKVVKKTLGDTSAYKVSGTGIDDQGYHKWQSTWDGNSEPKKWVIKGMDAGYYFIDDVLSLSGIDNDATAPFMLDVFRTVDKTMKSTAPTLDKSITSVKDLVKSGEKEDNVLKPDGHSARANIGDTVSYKLEGGFPGSFSTFYEKYTYEFTDTLGDGLDMVTSVDDIAVALSMDGGQHWLNIKNAPDSNIYTAKLDGKVLTVTFNDLIADYFTTEKTNGYNATRNQATNYADGTAAHFSGGDFVFSTFSEWREKAKIRVIYDAKLNTNAVVGRTEGNPNTAYLTYTNNPNNEGTGTSKTTEEKPKVFTYQINLHKKGNDTLGDGFLPGAKFQVSRMVKGTEYFAVFEGTSPTFTVSKWITRSEAESEEKTKITTGSDTDLKIAGLDVGTYTFTEVAAPVNYDLVDPFTVTLTDTNIDGILDRAVAKFSDDDLVPDGDVTAALQNDRETSTIQVAHVTVTDIRASILPHTGGSGVYFYYIAGGVLVAAALVLLVVSRRRARRSA